MRWIVDPRSRCAVVFIAALGVLAACESRPDVLQPDGRRFSVVGPESVAPNRVVHYVVEGDLDPARVVAWTSSRPEVLAPDGDGGGFVALAPGVATVRARVGFRTATLDVTVAAEVTGPRLEIAAAGDTVLRAVDDTVRLRALWRYADGSTADAAAAWFSSDTAVARVATGVVTARGAGRSVIQAMAGGKSVELGVRVVLQGPPPPVPVLLLRARGDTLLTAIGDTVWMEAHLVVAPGDTVPAQNPVWTSGTPEAATVAGGLVTARENGRSVISVRVGDQTRSLAVRVAQVPTRIVFTASEYGIPGIGGTVQLQAAARDARDHAVPGIALSWSSSDAARVGVSTSGLATGVAYGVATVTARAGALAAVVPVRVTGGVAPELRGLRAGITRVGDEPTPSYALVQFELRDPDLDMDSVVVQLLDAGGETMLRYSEAIARGEARHPFALHAATAAGATRARIRAYDAGGNVTLREVDLRTGGGPGAPRIDYLEATRIGSDSVEVYFEATDSELDTEIAWLLGFNADGEWTFVLGFVLHALESPEWAAVVGSRGAGVVAAVRFGVVLVDAQSNLSRVARTEASAQLTPRAAVRAPVAPRVRTRPLRIDAVRR